MKYIQLRLVCHKKRFVVAITHPMSPVLGGGGGSDPQNPPWLRPWGNGLHRAKITNL